MTKVTRKTTESEICVILSPGPVKKDYRSRIQTPIPFLTHMIEHIVWRSGLNLETTVDMPSIYSPHVVCEDLGITMGKAVLEYQKQMLLKGVCAFGDGIGIIDEARALTALSFESRSYFDLQTGSCSLPSFAEGMQSEDLVTFLEGFAQGAQCTVQIDIQRGVNAHHIWEAVFRSLGLALGRCLEEQPLRKGQTAGVAGGIQFIIENEENE